MKRVIVAGTRTFDDYDLLEERLDYYFKDIIKEGIEIVSGMARGADLLGEKYAIENGFPIKHFPADWKLNKKAAGPIRNEQMAQYADFLVAFWDGWSTGTADMVRRMGAIGKPVRVVRYTPKKKEPPPIRKGV